MERLQKVLAKAGIASRRAAEQIILAGRVRVDGRIVRELGTQVDERQSRIEVDGVKIVAEKLVYIVLHKPRGVVCTMSDPEGRPTISELIKEAGGRVVPVGRLDFHTSGALICTNDGEFAQGLAHPKREVPKVYVAKVNGTVDDEALERFSDSIVIDGRPTRPAQVKRLRFEGDKTWLEITLREGRNRQVRRLGEATGFLVMRLARLSHAGVSSEDLRPGQWRELTVDELVDLKKTYGVPKKVRSPSIEPAKAKAARGEAQAAKFDKRTRSEARPHKKPPAREPTPFDSRSPRPDPRNGPPSRFDPRAPRPDARGTRPETRPDPRGASRSSSRTEREPARGRSTGRFDSRAPRPDSRGGSAPRFDPRGPRPDPRGPRPNPRGPRPETRGSGSSSRFDSRSPRPESRGPRADPRPDARGASRSSSRKQPLHRELAHSASREDLNRPWKTRSRSASEGRPETNSARRRGGKAGGR